MNWEADKFCKPPIYHDLKVGRKTVAIVRRINGRKAKRGYRYDYQAIHRFVDGMGGALGPVFPSLIAAKRYQEGRIVARKEK